MRSPGYLSTDFMRVMMAGDGGDTVKDCGIALRLCHVARSEDVMTKVIEQQFIESTAGQVAAELARRGIPSDQLVTITIEPNDWLTEARRFSRLKVIEADWSDDDIDRLIKQAQQEVEPSLPG